MTWEEELIALQQKNKWFEAIDLMRQVVSNRPNDHWAYVQTIYLIHHTLLEEDCPIGKDEKLTKLLIWCFNQSKTKFLENADYLFFIGKILHIAEWYFGLSGNQLAFEFQEKAKNMKPGNPLFEWAYRLSVENDPIEEYLAHQILKNDNKIVNWLNNAGIPGAYVLEHLKESNKRFLENNK